MVDDFKENQEEVQVIPTIAAPNTENVKSSMQPSDVQGKGSKKIILIIGIFVLILALVAFFLFFPDKFKSKGETVGVTQTQVKVPKVISKDAMADKISKELDLLSEEDIYSLNLKIGASEYDGFPIYNDFKETFLSCIKYYRPFYCEAKVATDVSYCEKMGVITETRQFCFAMVNNDVSFCEKIDESDGGDPQEFKSFCLAKLKKDSSYCNNMPADRTDEKQTCFAVVTGDVSYCDAIKDPIKLNKCKAEINKDQSFCDNIENNNMEKSECLALASHDVSYCKNSLKERFGLIKAGIVEYGAGTDCIVT